MEIKINVTEADFGLEFAEIMKSLSHEEKREIAREIMLKSLNEVTDTQRTLIEKEHAVFEKIKGSVSSYEKDNYVTPEQMRKHYKYNEYMRDTKSAKEIAMQEILKAAIDTFKTMATEMVKKDENLKKIWEACSDQVKEDFPGYIHSAMTYYFAGQLQNIGNGVQEAMRSASSAAFSLENINRRLSGG